MIIKAAVKLATIFSQCSDNVNQTDTFNENHISYPILDVGISSNRLVVPQQVQIIVADKFEMF